VSNPVKNFSILAAGELIAKLMGLITTIYLARILGTEGFGVLGFAAALYGYFALFANPGFETVGTREVAKGKLTPGSIISSIFFLRAGMAVAAFVVLACVAFVSPFSFLVRTMVLIQGCNLLLVPFMFQFFFRGTKDMSAVAVSRIVQSVAYLLFILLFVGSEEQLLRVPVIFVASNLLSLLPLNARIIREFPLRSFRFDTHSMKEIGRHTLRVGGAALLVQIYVSFDTIILGYMKTAQEVGVYTAAYKVITFITIVPSLIFQAYLPELSKPSASSKNTATLKRYQTALICLGIPVGILGVIFARFILLGIFGDAFESGLVPFRILLVTAMIIYFNIAAANPLLAWGKEKEYLFIVGAGACVNIILNISLIPAYGIIGAAMATLAAEVTVLCVSLLHRYRLARSPYEGTAGFSTGAPPAAENEGSLRP
jgi:O-antigen/teichoic acid export membrane protein